MGTPLSLWFVVLGLIALMLAIDLFAHRKEKVIGFRGATLWSAIWLTIGLGFGVYVWAEFGSEFGQQYFAGFLIEKSLAIDNVFVWALIFAAFGVPREYQHRVLFLGVIGALIFRGIFIAVGVALISAFAWILYLFAALLLFLGVKMLIQRDEHPDPTQFQIYRWFSRTVATTKEFYGHRLVVRKNGVLLATPLAAVLVLVEFTDVLFAVDSIPAIFAVTLEPFLVFTANAFAVLGLRAMYFLLADLMHRFPYLKTGLAFILIWVGVKMALHDVVKMPTALSLGVIVLIITIAVGWSLFATRKSGRQAPEVTIRSFFPRANTEQISTLEPVWRNGKKHD